MVPTIVTVKRLKTCVEHSIEQREETYTAFERAPRTQKYTKEVCYLEDEVKTLTIKEKNCKRVMNPVVQTRKVDVPQTEYRYPEPECGCIDECTCGALDGGVVCPEQITTLRKEVCSGNRCEPQVVFEEVEKDIFFCVKEPKTRTEECAEETIYELKPVSKKRTVDVCVPKIVKRPVEVKVKKMLPKTIYCCEHCSSQH